MQLKTLVAALVLPFAVGLVPGPSATAAPASTGPAALEAGTGTANINEVVVVRRRRHHRRGYYTTRRVIYRHGRRIVIVRRHHY